MTTPLPARLARGEAAMADLAEVGGDSATVAGIACASYGIDQPWATWARPVTPPGDLGPVVDWLASRGGPWSVKVSAADTAAPAYRGLTEWLVLPVYVLAEPAGAVRVPGLSIGAPRDPAEFLAVYGASLAPLATARHLASPRYRFLVARLDGEPVGCALAQRAGDSAYVSAVTVRPEYRRRGIGAAISVAATTAATELTGGPVWLHAEDGPARIYRRLGYRRVDTHVVLTPR
ncbi:hypothetical protein Athai_64750 [Actinocatenispora thailandica]|uniref:N-acetyltransferase domain-containing protein n=1 Tax=Actinocatenispora thailandica TaxID=227318 RepID=A0A7R7DX29_9ACTN|nr:GNAT family N-acetyltransferase [Actinocatenispora thailandica]BCJ38972.1 hypothetical protein Athai_64750 [Actinocatenispora thailandica]